MQLVVLVAQNGKSIELDIQPHTRIDALQHTLASITGLSAGEQILMCDGRPLDSSQLLSAYNLPVDEGRPPRDVFLYCKSHLRQGAAAPEPETLPPIHVREPASGSIQYEPHPLDGAPSPLMRALPAYEREFRGHVLRGQDYKEAAQQRLTLAQQLLNEMNIQGMAIDAARSNVEHHYNYIQDACADFMRRYRSQAAAHEELLSRFERDMDALAAVELHPAARVGDATRLLDLLPEAKLRDWAAQCTRSHRQFADKVAGLDGLFAGLRADVEALFMQAPPTDMDALSQQCEDMRLHVEEQASIAAALESDFNRVQGLVEEAVRQLSAPPGAGSVGPLDAAGVMDTMHESHMQQLLPRQAACDAVLARFAEHCLDCKNQMSAEVVGQLRRISGQQSKISRARGQLAVFKQVAARQAEAMTELLLPRKLPAAYRHCLAECLRRKAFAEIYSTQAGELAERMGRLRNKETAQRDAFRAAVERLIPASVLAALGLASPPPHCVVSVPPTDTGLAAVTAEDLRRAPPAALQGPTQLPTHFADNPRSASASPRCGSMPAGEPAAVPLEAGSPGAEAEAAATPAAQQAALSMENARLRAELATQVAMACVAEQTALTRTSSSGTEVPRPATRQGVGSPAGSAVVGGSTESLRRSSVGSGAEASAETARQQGGSGGSSGGQDLPAARFRAALDAKDEVVARLDAELLGSRRQAAAYEARIGTLEAMLRSSGHGGSPGSSQSSAAASPQLSPLNSQPAGHLLSVSVSGSSTLGGSALRSPEALDPAQRAVLGTAVAHSAERPPRSPQLPPSGSPRAASGSGLLPPLSLGPAAVPPLPASAPSQSQPPSPPPAMLPAAATLPAAAPPVVVAGSAAVVGAAAAAAAEPRVTNPARAPSMVEAVAAPVPLQSAFALAAAGRSGSFASGSSESAGNSSVADAKAPQQLAAPILPQPAAEAAAQQQPPQAAVPDSSATRQPSICSSASAVAAATTHTVVLSPSLTSLADAGTSTRALTSSPPKRINSDQDSSGSGGSGRGDAAELTPATSGFRVTGFITSGPEQAALGLEQSNSVTSSTASGGGGGGNQAAAASTSNAASIPLPRPQPTLVPPLGSPPSAARPISAAAAARQASAGLAGILDDQFQSGERRTGDSEIDGGGALPGMQLRQPQAPPLPLPMSPPELLPEDRPEQLPTSHLAPKAADVAQALAAVAPQPDDSATTAVARRLTTEAIRKALAVCSKPAGSSGGAEGDSVGTEAAAQAGAEPVAGDRSQLSTGDDSDTGDAPKAPAAAAATAGSASAATGFASPAEVVASLQHSEPAAETAAQAQAAEITEDEGAAGSDADSVVSI